MITAKGIDEAGRSRLWTVDGTTPEYLADALCRLGWRWVNLTQDGREVGGVKLDSLQLKRIPWARDAEEGTVAHLQR